MSHNGPSWNRKSIEVKLLEEQARRAQQEADQVQVRADRAGRSSGSLGARPTQTREVGTIHPKAMPVLTTAQDIERWMQRRRMTHCPCSGRYRMVQSAAPSPYEANIIQKEPFMDHAFAVGQEVTLAHSQLRRMVTAEYRVLRLMPDRQYRIKSATDQQERVAPEGDLTASPDRDVFSQASTKAASIVRVFGK